MVGDNPNGWEEWSRFVLNELKRHNDTYDTLVKEIQTIRIDIATLKMKASFWGAISGGVATAGLIAIWLFKELITGK